MCKLWYRGVLHFQRQQAVYIEGSLNRSCSTIFVLRHTDRIRRECLWDIHSTSHCILRLCFRETPPVLVFLKLPHFSLTSCVSHQISVRPAFFDILPILSCSTISVLQHTDSLCLPLGHSLNQSMHVASLLQRQMKTGLSLRYPFGLLTSHMLL